MSKIQILHLVHLTLPLRASHTFPSIHLTNQIGRMIQKQKCGIFINPNYNETFELISKGYEWN